MTTENQNQSQEAMYMQHQMSEPKSTQGVFELPCGFLSPDGELITEVKVREITGVEEDLLAAKNISGGKKLTQLLGNCLEQLGPMTDKPFLQRAARELTVGDRSYLMLAIRRVTLGDDFPFEDSCTECEAKSLFVVNLGTLTTRKMPDAKKRIFTEKLPSGKTARFHIMTGKDEESLAKIDANDKMSVSILIRVDTIDDAPVTLEVIKSLSMKDRNFLRERFNEVEGGVETSVELSCPNCGADFMTELDVSQTGFFFPSRIRKNSKRNTSSF